MKKPTFEEWVEQKELPIDDNGEVKDCPFTRYKRGYWYCFKQFKMIKETKQLIKNIEWVVLTQAIIVLLLLPILPVLILLSPVINPYFAYKNAKKRCFDDYTWRYGNKK